MKLFCFFMILKVFGSAFFVQETADFSAVPIRIYFIVDHLMQICKWHRDNFLLV